MMIIEEGTISQAALRLGLSKAAVSKQLIDLESQLSVQLLSRDTRKISLTPAGEIYYDSVKKVFDAVSEAEAIVSKLHHQPIGTLRIASHKHFGEKIILDNIKEFITAYPHLKLDIEFADRFPDIEKEGFDILCGMSSDGPDHLVRKRIATTKYVLCAAPAYIKKYGHPKTPDDLMKHHYITHSFRNPDNVISFKNHHDVYLDYTIRVNDAQAMLKCATNGLGFIKIFRYFVGHHIKNAQLIEILKEYPQPSAALYLFYKQQKYLPKKIRLFIDFIHKKTSEHHLYF